MANPTILQFKTAVAGQLGKSNAAIVVTKRDVACAEAIEQYINEHPWRWNRKTSTVVIVGGYASLPTTMSTDFEPTVYRMRGTEKLTYEQCELDDIASKSAGTYFYAIDEENRRIYCSENETLQVRHQKICPTYLFDLSDDSTTLPFSDKTTPVQLAIGKYWLSAERDEDEYERFVNKKYIPMLRRDKKRDGSAGPQVVAQSRFSRMNLGWNRKR